ncbi:restriction endonuclease [Rhodanobacter denitrificans]|uniref:Restriction endonuclease n=1 Tax=Rhodanobacter denitrificans TaxID=666685 RepID=M4NIG9_9GAMM|nr:restriction endonuclease [Rhodanobacter denitrificans]AGG87596.1 Restriction endonuclease [Rhodanobacter denitrificans]UJM86768.1 restriction endonuclease [Rhodanobacter denitrificans]
MNQEMPEWKLYERLVARMLVEQLETDLCVTPNAYIVGRITGVPRQIDVLIETRHDTDNSRRIIVDAKKRSRKIDVKDVESFRGLMEDVGATHGYLVSPAGYTKAAGKRAQAAVSIRIVPLDRLEDFDPSTWPRCQREGCKHGRVFWDGYPELTVVLRPLDDSEPVHQSSVHYVGKCDRCGRFHVRCLVCNDILAPPEDDEDDCGHQCSCRPPWFWLASIEEDEDGHDSAELHACLMTGRVITVDRRSL